MLFILLQAANDGLRTVSSGGIDFSQLILILCGLAAVYLLLQQKQQQQYQQPPIIQQPVAPANNSAELRALQDSVRLLLETQQRQQQQQLYQPYPPQQQQQQLHHPTPQRTVPISFPQREDSPEPEEYHSSSASSNKLQRTPSYMSTLPNGGAAGGAVPFELLQDMKQYQDMIKNLERKNRELNRQLTLTEVSNVVDVEKKYRLPIPVVNNDGSSTTKQLNLSASEIETIRAIFNMHDTDQSGTISTREVQALHKQLGEPLTDDETSAAISELDPEETGTVTFNKFLIWWYQSHAEGKKGSAYTQRFKLMHAKLTAGNFDVEKVITQDSGEIFTLEYRLNFYYKGHNQSLRQISPWHDIPLNRFGSGVQGQLYNFVCEIPKWTRAKFECATGELYNPIKQDTQHGKLRYYKHGDMMFNYGFFPQTWEDPEVIPDDTKCPGDNDPIDCVEIGATQLRVGTITAVKILGLLGLIDDGETDWKLIAISINDPMAHLLNDVDDVEVHLPGAIKAIREYFRDYKSFSGKINTYALRAQAMPRSYAIKVLEETHQHWKSLHLVRKLTVIGESGHQAESRKIDVVTPSNAASPSGLVATSLTRGTSSPQITKSSPQPLAELTGVEQPLDKLMAGK